MTSRTGRRSSNAVNHPDHYGGEDNPYEAIKVIEAWGLDKDFLLGNTLKYIARRGKKDEEIQELEKACWYLNRKIANLKKEIESAKRSPARNSKKHPNRRPGPRVRKAGRLHGKRPVRRPSGKGVIRRRVAGR